jgi:hypothetical protein
MRPAQGELSLRQQDMGRSTSPVVPAPATPEFVTPPANDDDRLDAAHSDTPVRYHAVKNLIGGGELLPGLAPRNLDAELHL